MQTGEKCGLADRLVLEPDDATLLPDFIERMELRVSGPHMFTLLDEAIGLFGLANRSVGEAHLEAGGGTLTVSNIGSSGKDGVSIDVGETLDLFRAEVEVDPATIRPGGQCVASAVGQLAGGPAGQTLSTLTAQALPTASVQITPDFSPLGATTSSVQLFLDGHLVFSQSGLSGPGCIVPPPPRCRVLCGPSPEDTMVIDVRFPEGPLPVSIPGGPTILADQLVLEPDDQTASIDFVSDIELRAGGTYQGDGTTCP